MATKKAVETAPVEAVVVEEPVAVVEAPAVVPPAEVPVEQVPVAVVPADATPETVVLTETTPPPHQVIVVDAPVAPRKKGNGLLALGLAVVATLIFTALLVVTGLVLSIVAGDGVDLGFLTEPAFYLPAVAFFVGLVLVSLVLNRAGWWSHIIGSVVVGLITWLGGASLALLAAGMFSMNQAEANEVFYAALFSPFLIIAALLAREVSIWTGAILARRGRSLKVRNAEAQAQFEREQAELTPTAF